MPTQPPAILATITTAGMAEVLTAVGQGLQGEITHIGLGTTEFTADENTASIPGEIAQWPLGDGEKVSPTQLNLYAEVTHPNPAGSTLQVKSLGVYLSTGTLLAVYAVPAGTTLLYLSPGITIDLFYQLVLSALPANSVTINNTGIRWNPGFTTWKNAVDAELADHEARIVVLEGASFTIPDATTTVKGKAELATHAEVQAGTDDVTIVTPAGLQSKTASATTIGLVELATNAETQTGADSARAVTPASLSSRTATTTRTGLIEIATNDEVNTGTDATRAVTPASLKQRLDAGLSGSIVKRGRDEVSGLVEVTGVYAYDNTAPLVSGGEQVLLHAYTPVKVGNILEVTAIINANTPVNAGDQAIAALFSDSTVRDVSAVGSPNDGSAFNDIKQIQLTAEITVTSLTAINFSVRCGTSNVSYPVYINGKRDGTALFGGAMNSFLSIKEYSS